VAHLQSNGNGTAKVLELGCGAGVPATKYLLDVERPFFSITGNDISTSQLDLARSNLAQYADRLTLMEGDMLALSFPAATFDAVTGFYSIIHLPREEQTQLMSKIMEWLKPGGYFLANFSIRDLPILEEDKWLGHEKGWMFWSSWGEAKSVEMVENVGLKVSVKGVRQAVDDTTFVWMLARKGEV
jgi:SAM-dependent methyltransferase